MPLARLFVLGATLLFASGSSPAEVMLTMAPPDGFDEWEQPQETLVDLYQGGEPKGQVRLRYDGTTLTVLQPQRLVEQLDQLRDPQQLSEHLTGPRERHHFRPCSPLPSCAGDEWPPLARLYFDETRFRLDVVINPAALTLQMPIKERYLPPPDASSWGAIQNLHANYAGSSREQDSYTLFGGTRVGKTHVFGYSDWRLTSTQNQIEELAVGRDFTHHQLRAGLIRSETDQLTLLGQPLLVGASVRRSLHARTDLESALGTPIEVFLPSTSRVDLIKDGQLYDSRTYGSGNQRLDTRPLPHGAYPLTIVITDNSGAQRQLQRFFIKSNALLPSDTPLWFVEAGDERRLSEQQVFPERTQRPQLRAGYRWRQSDTIGLGAATALAEQDQVLELSGQWFGSHLQTGGQLLISSHNEQAWRLHALSRWHTTTLALDVQGADLDRATGEEVIPERLLPRIVRQYQVQLSQPVYAGRLLASSQYLQVPGEPAQTIHSASYQQPLWRGGRSTVELQAGVSHGNQGWSANLGIQWRRQTQHWQSRLQPQWRRSPDTGSEGALLASARWQDQDRWRDDVSAGVQGEFSRNLNSITVDGQSDGHWGRFAGSLTQSDTPDGQATLSHAQLQTALAWQSGHWGLGGRAGGESALIVEVSGAEDADFDLFIEDQERLALPGERRLAVTLPPYRRYRVRLSDSGDTLAEHDSGTHEVTLYPGNVVTLDWEVQQSQLVVGHLLDAHDKPLRRARITNLKSPAFTDGEGYFQAEIDSGQSYLQVDDNGQQCRVMLPTTPPDKPVIVLGRRQCLPSTR